jgi:excisionase family DNA binding protein
MTTLAFSLGDEDLQRIADAVAARLDQRPAVGWLTVDAAAAYTSLSKEAIRTATKRGRLKSHKGDSGRLVFRTADLDTFMGGVE